MATKEALLLEREEKADALDAEIERLKQALDNQKATEEARVQAEVEKAKKGIEQSANIAKAMDKRSHEAEMSIANSKIEGLQQRVAELNTSMERANASIDAANQKVADMAQAALKAGADANTVAELHKAAAMGGKK